MLVVALLVLLMAFEAIVRTWYRMMGWDDRARPTYETLVDHHLEWVLDEH